MLFSGRIFILLFLLAGFTFLTATGCGGKGTSRVDVHAKSSSPAVVPPGSNDGTDTSPPAVLSRVIAEIEALEAPAGIETQVWQALKDRLVQELAAKDASQVTAHPPSGEYNRVADLHLTAEAHGPLIAVWSYLNRGDYNQDGEATINDLTPLGAHYLEESAVPGVPFPYETEQSAIDGDGNGVININDITPLGANLLSTVSEFRVYATGALGIRLLGTVSMADAEDYPGQRKIFRFVIEPAYLGDEYWVVPSDGVNEGVPSLPQDDELPRIANVNPASGTVGEEVNFRVRAEGSPPLTCMWQFGAAATPSVSADVSPTVILGPAGSYTPRVTVTNDQSADTYLFPLLILEPGEIAGRGDWWMYGRDPQHTSRSPYIGPASGQLRWMCEIGHYGDSSPAIGKDGTIYIGGNKHNNLVALNHDGTGKWAYDTAGEVISSPAIGTDGTLYIGSHDDHLHAVNPDGSKKWTFQLGDIVSWSSPALDAEGNIYIGCKDRKLYAVKPDGTEKWIYETGDWVYSSPAIGFDGTVYVGSFDRHLHAIDSNGNPLWTFPTWNRVIGSPAIGADGTIYFGSQDHHLYAVNPDGSEQWSYDTGASIENAPALGADGAVYIPTGGGTQAGAGKVVALNADGTLRWESILTSAVSNSSPALDANGTLYFGSEDGKVHALNPDGSVLWIYDTGVGVRCSPALGPDGTLYVASAGQRLYAIGPGGGAPQSVPVEILDIQPRCGGAGEEVTFSATLSGTAPCNYQWNFGGGATPNESSAASPIVTLGSKGAYDMYLSVVSDDISFSDIYCCWLIVGDGTIWARSYYGTAADVGQDSSGNIYVAGSTEYFGSVPTDVLVLKYSAAGELLWQRTWGGTGGEGASALAVSADGGVYVTGGTSSFGAGEKDVFLLKYSASGELLWQRTWGEARIDVGADVAVDSGMLDGIEHVYVSGSYTVESPDDHDAVLLKYTPGGDLLWQQCWGGPNQDYGGALDVHYNSAGSYEMIYQSGTTDSYGAGDDDIFLLRIQPTGGDPLWQRTWGSSLIELEGDLIVDSNENIYVTATYSLNEDWTTGDAALLKFSSGGALSDQRTWNENEPDLPEAITLDDSGSIWVAGRTRDLEHYWWDMFVLKFTPACELDGQRVWGRWHGEYAESANDGVAYALIVAPNGDLVVVGRYGPVGLWEAAGGVAGVISGTLNTPAGTITTMDGAVGTPIGFETSPYGEGVGEMTVIRYNSGM